MTQLATVLHILDLSTRWLPPPPRSSGGKLYPELKSWALKKNGNNDIGLTIYMGITCINLGLIASACILLPYKMAI